jgi:hypothetical protein
MATQQFIHGAITHDRLAQAFEAWERGFRAEPQNFRTGADCLALGVSQISAERADYFFELLRHTAPPPSAVPPELQAEAQRISAAIKHLAAEKPLGFHINQAVRAAGLQDTAQMRRLMAAHLMHAGFVSFRAPYQAKARMWKRPEATAIQE